MTEESEIELKSRLENAEKQIEDVSRRLEKKVQSLESENQELKSKLEEADEQKKNAYRRQVLRPETEESLIKELNARLEKAEKKIKDALGRLDWNVQSSESNIRKLKSELENAEKQTEEARRRSEWVYIVSEKELVSELQELKSKLEIAEEQKEDALRRLSEIISVKLRDSNPNIADLTNPYRPTKLAEISSELYDNEWTRAFDVLEKSYLEEDSIVFLLDIIMDTFHFCKKTIEDEWKIVLKWHVMDAKENKEKMHWLKENRKTKIQSLLPEVTKDCFQFLISNTVNNSHKKLLSDDKDVNAYVNTCVKLCLYMCVQDPPCVMHCPGWRSGRSETQKRNEDGLKSKENNKIIEDGKDSKEKDDDYSILNAAVDRKEENDETEYTNERRTSIEGKGNIRIEQKIINTNYEKGNGKKAAAKEIENEHFDKNLFKEYTQSGKFISYIVWPIIYLHDDGPVLSKGVAQGCKTRGSMWP